MVCASLLARLPTGMIGLAIPLIALASELSPTTAGFAAAGYRAGQAITTPLWGRIADRAPLHLLLRTAPIGYGLLVLIIGASGSRPLLLCVCASALGCLTLPYSAVMRAFWNRQSDIPDKVVANAFESFMSEAVLLGGRSLMVLTALVLPIRITVFGQAVTAVAGALMLSATSRVRVDHPAERHHHDSSTSIASERRLLAHLLLTFMVFAAALGGFALMLVVLLSAQPNGNAWAAAAVTAWGFGSLLGIGPLTRILSGPGGGATAGAVVMMGCAFAATCVVPMSAATMLISAFVSGLPVAAVLTCLYGVLAAASPSGRQNELFAWAMTAILIGDAGGTAALGLVLGHFHSGAGAAPTALLTILAAVAVATIPKPAMWSP